MRPKLTALRTVAATAEKLCSTGKRNAVGNKSRSTVANSALVLRRPTSPPTAGRKPEASPPSISGVGVDVGVGIDVGVGVDVGVEVDVGIGVDVSSSQLKSWAATQSYSRNVLASLPRQLDDSDITELREFFALLDRGTAGDSNDTKIETMQLLQQSSGVVCMSSDLKSQCKATKTAVLALSFAM
jgi:hypothetical protein